MKEVWKRYLEAFKKIEEEPWLIAILVLGFIYGVNEVICQMFTIGPQWFRWHASSFGFSAAWSVVFYSFFSISIYRAVWLAFVIEIIWEIGQLPNHCDFVDILIACLGTGLILGVRQFLKNRSLSFLAVR